MNYSKPAFIYPPRAEHASDPAQLHRYDNGQYAAQVKYNGDCVIVVMTETATTVYNRYGQLYTKAKPGVITHSLYRGKGVMVLCGEYLSKSQAGELEAIRSNNNCLVLWDILVYDGQYLIGKSTVQRIDLLEELYPSSLSEVTATGDMVMYNYLRCTKQANVYMAQTIMEDFDFHYNEIIRTPLYEGLVLKKVHAKLEFGYNEKNNGNWQLKFRKPTLNYKF